MKKLTEEQKEIRRKEREEKQEAIRIENEKNQKPVREITIRIEWKKSRMWGNNPHCEATVVFLDGSTDTSPVFKCSGCGYDKESTVVADVFNQYLKYKLHIIGETNNHPYGVYLRKDWKSYNGGVGISCYYKIAEFIGGSFHRMASGKTYDVYKYTDIAGKLIGLPEKIGIPFLDELGESVIGKINS